MLSTYPARRIKKILNDLFNQGIDILVSMTMRYEKLSPDSGREALMNLYLH